MEQALSLVGHLRITKINIKQRLSGLLCRGRGRGGGGEHVLEYSCARYGNEATVWRRYFDWYLIVTKTTCKKGRASVF